MNDVKEQPRLVMNCTEEYKKAFKDHCGIVPQSAKIRDLIDNDIERAENEKEELEEFHRQRNYPK